MIFHRLATIKHHKSPTRKQLNNIEKSLAGNFLQGIFINNRYTIYYLVSTTAVDAVTSPSANLLPAASVMLISALSAPFGTTLIVAA